MKQVQNEKCELSTAYLEGITVSHAIIRGCTYGPRMHPGDERAVSDFIVQALTLPH